MALNKKSETFVIYIVTLETLLTKMTIFFFRTAQIINSDIIQVIALKQNDQARFLSIAKFVYNNNKNVSIGHILFKLNCDYHFQMSYKDNINFCFKFKSVDKLLIELREFMIVCR